MCIHAYIKLPARSHSYSLAGTQKGGENRMAYAKFVTRMNKEGKPISYGPYYYKSIRTPEGRVQNIYLGTSLPVNENGKKGMQRLRDLLARFVAS
jgi:hypothetical protein